MFLIHLHLVYQNCVLYELLDAPNSSEPFKSFSLEKQEFEFGLLLF